MTRRASLPGVDELFRSSGPKESVSEPEVAEAPSLQVAKAAPVEEKTSEELPIFEEPEPQAPTLVPVPAQVPEPGQAQAAPAGESDAGRRPRHEEKVTFYCTPSDLTRIERARLALRAEHKLASDRGRIVRAALAEILDDFETQGPDSALVRRLKQDRN